MRHEYGVGTSYFGLAYSAPVPKSWQSSPQSRHSFSANVIDILAVNYGVLEHHHQVIVPLMFFFFFRRQVVSMIALSKFLSDSVHCSIP